MRQRYSKDEALNRILRIMQGKPPTLDVPTTLPGEVLSENEVISDIAELLASSLPNELATPIPAFARYGHIFNHNTNTTVLVGSPDIYYGVSGGFNAGLMSGFTFANAMHLRPTYAGRYLMSFSVSVQSASANQEVEASLLVNSIAHTGSSAHAQGLGTNVPAVLSGMSIADLPANSIVGIGLANHTGANNLVVAHGNISILLIAPYSG